MCILFVAIEQHPRYPLIIAANRDEFFKRPSQPAHYWNDAPQILAGRDLQAKGTWLGTSTAGHLAAVTNLRAPALYRDDASSRGKLVTRYLRGEETIEQYRNFVTSHHAEYNPFNLLFGSVRQLWVFSSLTPVFTRLKPGFHSISNGLLDEYWPKMSRGVLLLEQCILQADALNVEQLAAIMRDTTQADDAALPVTGISRADEKRLSSIFITGTDYGTRTTSLLLCKRSSTQLFEYNYGPGGELTDSQSFEL